MSFPSLGKFTVFFRASIWHHFLKFLDLRDEHSEFNFKTFDWFRHPTWEKKIVLKLLPHSGSEGRSGGKRRIQFLWYWRVHHLLHTCSWTREDHLSSSVPQAGTVWVVYGYDATENQVWHIWSMTCISQFQKVNSLCVTHKCRMMEDLLWGIVWPLTSLHRTINGLQTYHLEWSVMGGFWKICFWTLSYGAKSNGFCRCECVK